jgi:hypothetical protein
MTRRVVTIEIRAQSDDNSRRNMMKSMKRAFLFFVGVISVAYEETVKAIEKQRTEVEKRFDKKPA